MTWQPSDEQVEAGARAMLGRFPVMDHDVPLGYRDLTDVDRNLIECAVFDTLIAAHAVQSPVDVEAFGRALNEFLARGKLAHGGYLAGNADREREFNALAEQTRQRLIDMYRERGL